MRLTERVLNGTGGKVAGERKRERESLRLPRPREDLTFIPAEEKGTPPKNPPSLLGTCPRSPPSPTPAVAACLQAGLQDRKEAPTPGPPRRRRSPLYRPSGQGGPELSPPSLAGLVAVLRKDPGRGGEGERRGAFPPTFLSLSATVCRVGRRSPARTLSSRSADPGSLPRGGGGGGGGGGGA